MKERKIVQISHAYYGQGECGTFALADDGTVWGWNWREKKWEDCDYPSLPPREDESEKEEGNE